MEPKKRELT